MGRKRFLISILLLSLIAVLFLPIYTSLYLYPSFSRHFLADAESSAKQMASHLIKYFVEPENGLGYEDITIDVKDEIGEMVSDFGCEKVKIYAPSGEIIYSTDPADIGTINTKDYFKNVVTKGTDFTSVVKKDNRTAEGRIVSLDIVETYVPLKFGSRIVGASEVYYEITEHRKNIETLVRQSAAIVIFVTSLLLIAVFVTLYKLNKNMTAREQTEKELSLHRDQLEGLVKDRTAELRQANILLQADIEKRQQAEKALRESEEKYRGLIETASEAIFVIDYETGTIIDVNRKGLGLLGKSADEIIGLHHSQLHPADETEKYIWLFKKFANYLSPPDITFHVMHKDGYRIPVEISTSIMELEGRKIIQGIFRDIRERIKLEEEIQKAQRLESAGVIAGGMAHDFNNLLTSILGNVSLAKVFAEPSGKVFERLAETEKAIMRAKDLTQQLLTFAKGGVPVTRTVDLGNTLVESAEFALRGSTLKCQCRVAENLWPVEADLGQINQVIHNLVLNAYQSMREGGSCRLEAENILVRDTALIPLPEGRYVKISVHDEGSGIAPEHLNKIFDPFFTTKRSGTGLGLPTAYSIIKKHGGVLTVDSEVGKGSTFYIFLPASDKKVLPAADDEAPPGNFTGTGRILLMDDEEFLLQMASELLQHLGYTVDTAKDGHEALDLYKKGLESGQKYAAVIMDLTIQGGMGGKETIEALRKIDPDAKTIVSSGYATDPIMANFKEYGFDAMLPKPYEVAELAVTLHKVMRQSG
jgi:PAS domain S-box-containing protein